MLNIILWVLAIFGILQLCIQIVTLESYKKVSNENTYLILTVINQETTIEELIKSILWTMPTSCLKVVDLGSSDDTLAILQQMKKIYTAIEIEDKTFLQRLAKSEENRIIGIENGLVKY